MLYPDTAVIEIDFTREDALAINNAAAVRIFEAGRRIIAASRLVPDLPPGGTAMYAKHELPAVLALVERRVNALKAVGAALSRQAAVVDDEMDRSRDPAERAALEKFGDRIVERAGAYAERIANAEQVWMDMVEKYGNDIEEGLLMRPGTHTDPAAQRALAEAEKALAARLRQPLGKPIEHVCSICGKPKVAVRDETGAGFCKRDARARGLLGHGKIT